MITRSSGFCSSVFQIVNKNPLKVVKVIYLLQPMIFFKIKLERSECNAPGKSIISKNFCFYYVLLYWVMYSSWESWSKTCLRATALGCMLYKSIIIHDYEMFLRFHPSSATN